MIVFGPWSEDCLPSALRLSSQRAGSKRMSAQNEGIEVGAADKAAWDAAVSSFRRTYAQLTAEQGSGAAGGDGTSRPAVPSNNVRSGLAGLAALSWGEP